MGEAAKMVDVVVVFYAAAYLGSEMFEFAFRTLVNEALPHLGRPYTVYRFPLDDEPEFVPEMAATLGLPPDNPVTVAGFAWSGPGRRLFILGDNALRSQAVFQRALRRSLAGEPAEAPRASGARRPIAASIERSERTAVRPWGGRLVAILAWCLFGTAALGAAVVGVAPKWTNSLLHPTSVPGSDTAPDKSPSPGSGPMSAIAPPLSSDTLDVPPAAGSTPAAKPAKPARHAQRKHAPRLTFSPTYWGLPTEDRSR